MQDLPQLVDGGEAEEAVMDVEEEFKLDEIMSEEVKEMLRKEERLAQVGSAHKPRTPVMIRQPMPWHRGVMVNGHHGDD